MAGGVPSERGSRRRDAAVNAVVPLPRDAGDRFDLARILPSGRSLAVGFAIVVAVFAAYWVARGTSLFAVDRVEIKGASPDVVRDVRAVTRGALGASLLDVDTDEIEGKVRALPSVVGVSVDRAFPHTLVIKVAAEHPVAVVRRAERAWLVTGSGRIIRAVPIDTEPGLARIWVPRQFSIRVGGALPTTYRPAAHALAGLREVHFPAHVKGVRVEGGELTFALRTDRQILVGTPTEVLLKLAVAAQILPHLDGDLQYLDVSVPERPVASAYPKLSG